MELKFGRHQCIDRLACVSKLYLSGIEISEFVSRDGHLLAPNCTLVELKFVTPATLRASSSISKLYLSGIEIGGTLIDFSLR